MGKIHYALSSIKYHKRMSLMAVGIFSLFLCISTALLWLIQFQDFRTKQLSTLLTTLIPNSSLIAAIKIVGKQLSRNYFFLHFITLLIFLIAISIFLGVCLHFRKKEIKSLKLLNLSPKQIFQQYFIELLVSLLVSLLLIGMVCTVFVNSFTNSLSRINQEQFSDRLPKTFEATYNQDYSQEQADSFGLTPYETQYYAIRARLGDTSSVDIIQLLCYNALFLLLATFISILIIRLLSPSILK